MNDIFLKNLPTIDLHGYDVETARVATDDFINESLIMKNSKIVIIHGKGLGLVKNSVHNVLSKRKEVIKFNTDNLNDGCTIVYLNIDKN
ncbi:MAG: Smr/MutS family protein [Bacilli bacterium]